MPGDNEEPDLLAGAPDRFGDLGLLGGSPTGEWGDIDGRDGTFPLSTPRSVHPVRPRIATGSIVGDRTDEGATPSTRPASVRFAGAWLASSSGARSNIPMNMIDLMMSNDVHYINHPIRSST